MKVQTGVWAPTASTESRMSRAPALSQSMAAVRIVGGLAVAHFAGVERLVALGRRRSARPICFPARRGGTAV